MTARRLSQHWRLRLVHSLRVLLFAVTIGLIHVQFAGLAEHADDSITHAVDAAALRCWFPDAESVGPVHSGVRSRDVLNGAGIVIGTIQDTSPGSDHVVGFSGPTNVRIALTPDDQIAGVEILRSFDTPEHVQQILDDPQFLDSFAGRSRQDVVQQAIDGVSGATLTSMAIQESVIHALSGQRASLRFPQPLAVEDVRLVFEAAHTLEAAPDDSGCRAVRDVSGTVIGSVLRSSPHSDRVVGYQGPSDILIGIDASGRIVGVHLLATYDNEPYTAWVREEQSFWSLFEGLMLEDLTKQDSQVLSVEGVSGATMTSQAIVEGLVLAAQLRRETMESETSDELPVQWQLRDAGTALVILCGCCIGFSRLRRSRMVRLVFQIVLIVYLGLINGDMVSQAMLVGWARTGIPWERAGGLVLLTAAALCIPIFTRRNIYCTHLCPHGAVQQLARNRLPWRFQLSRRLVRTLKLVPAALLFWCVTVAMTGISFSLVDIEPFDAWLFRITGWASLLLAITGLFASLFVPMAYCRFGCPTGALLSYLRLNGRSDRWSRRDWMAVALVLLAGGLCLMS